MSILNRPSGGFRLGAIPKPAGALARRLGLAALLAAALAATALAGYQPTHAQDPGGEPRTDPVEGQMAPPVSGLEPRINSVAMFSRARSAPYGIGDPISVVAIFSEGVVADGKSCIPIDVGGKQRMACFEPTTGTYNDLEDTYAIYTYRTQEGDEDTDGVSVPSGHITFESCAYIRDDQYDYEETGILGLNIRTDFQGFGDQSKHKVDGVRPSIDGVSLESHGEDFYDVGDVITAQVTFSEPVTITGNPTLTLQVGDSQRAATYAGQQSDDGLVADFAYTTQSGDLDDNGVSISDGQLTLAKDDAIIDAAGNTAKPAFKGVTDQSPHQVDARPLTVEEVSLASSGPYAIGDDIQVDVEFTRSFKRTGAPVISLKVGDRNVDAKHQKDDAAATTMRFAYTVAQGDLDTDGVSIPAGALRFADGTGSVKTARGVAGTLTYDKLADASAHKVDGVRPAVAAVFLNPAETVSYYGVGSDILAMVSFDEAVTITGQPTLKVDLDDGQGTATYLGVYADAVNTHTFKYTVAQGDRARNGVAVPANAVALSEGVSVKDAVGNDADLSHQAVARDGNHRIVPPVQAEKVAVTPGRHGIGDVLQAVVSFDDRVSVVGSPELSLTVGDAAKTASCSAAGAGKEKMLECSYTVVEGDLDTDGVSISENALSLPEGASVKDERGLNVNLSHAAVAAVSTSLVDGVRPAVSSFSVSGNAATYGEDDVVTIAAQFSEAVTVTGKPELDVNIGGNTRPAQFASGSGDTVNFAYTVQDGEHDGDGVSVDAGNLRLAGGVIKDAFGNAAALSHKGMDDDDDHKVSALPTVASAITMTDAAKHFGAGDTVRVSVAFNEPVTVAGKPTISLKIGDAARTAVFQRKDGNSLVFAYTVKDGDNDADGVSVPAARIGLPSGASISNAKGSQVALGHPALPYQSGHVVDTRRPEYDQSGTHPNGFAFIGAHDSDPVIYASGAALDVLVYFDEPVRVEHKPTIEIVVGDRTRVAEYESKGVNCPEGEYCRNLRFRYKVATNDADLDGVAVKAGTILYPGQKGSIKDRAGNKAKVNHNGWSHGSNPRVDARPIPKLVEVIMKGLPRTKPPGDYIIAYAKFSAPVVTQGDKPTLSIRIGDQTVQSERTVRAPAVAGLIFFYRVKEGQTDHNGVSIPANPITLGEGGTIRSASGVDAVLTYSGTPDNPDYPVGKRSR